MSEARSSQNQAGASPESGFSLVEVLIALVIVSMLALALGGLIIFAMSLRDRASDSDRILQAILNVEALRSVILHAVNDSRGVAITGPTGAGFSLTASDSRLLLPLMIAFTRVGETDAPRDIVASARNETHTSYVDLSTFDGASIDYLGRKGDAPIWMSADSVGVRPDGVRLTIRQGAHSWTVLLWIRSQSSQ